MNTLASIERQLNPFDTYSEMRRNSPVYLNPERGNYNIFRFEDVQRVLSDYGAFSSQFAGENRDSTSEPFSASMIATDPPRHRQLRALVTQAFTPKAVEALAPRIDSIVREHLDAVTSRAVGGRGEMDVIRDLGYPLPVIVIAEMLGIPAEDRAKFKEWSDVIVSLAEFGSDSGQEIDYGKFTSPAIMEMSMYFFNMIQARQATPGDDLISGLLKANINGEGLGMVELLGFCALLLVAGNETTTNLIGNAMLTFAEQPEVWQRLRQNPDLLPQAIEEVLRYRSPVQAMFRVARQEVEVAGTRIPAGSPLVAWIGSANHDEAQFTDPDVFELDRPPSRHLAFGHGIHFCLGAPLARLEARYALGALLERFKSIELTPGAALERQPSLIVYGVRSLPIRFELA